MRGYPQLPVRRGLERGQDVRAGGGFRASHQEAGPFLGVCVHGDSGVYTAEPMDEAREGEMPADGSVGLPLGGLG